MMRYKPRYLKNLKEERDKYVKIFVCGQHEPYITLKSP